MIVLPTRGRPLSLKRFVAHYLRTEAVLPVQVVMDADDADKYESIGLPNHWPAPLVNPINPRHQRGDQPGV